MSNTHTFFCTDLDCEKEVKEYGMACEDHASDTLSECPGCGMDIFVGANGYCSHCWVERFGCEEEHECHGEMDYERGVRVCDDQDDPACPQHYLWKDEQEAKLTREPKEWYCTCNRETGLMCDGCSEVYKQTCRGCGVTDHLWTDEKHCRKCYVKLHGDEFPPLPPPAEKTPEELREQIEHVEAQMRTKMTPSQWNDWNDILQKVKAKLRRIQCDGCRDDILNQQGHMGPGGCLDDEECTPWEDYDTDDLRKLDLQLSRYH